MSFWNSVSETSSQGYLAWATDLVSSYVPDSMSSFVSDRWDQKESVAVGIVIGTIATVATYFFFKLRATPKLDISLVGDQKEGKVSTTKTKDEAVKVGADPEENVNKKLLQNPFSPKKNLLKKVETIPTSKIVKGPLKKVESSTSSIDNPVKKTDGPPPKPSKELTKKESKISLRKTASADVKVSFCVGMGQELKGECEKKVKQVVTAILTMVQNTDSRIKIGAVGFNKSSFLISDPTVISKSEEVDPFTSKLVTKVNESKPDGITSINAGLDESIRQLSKKSFWQSSAGKNVIILFSDKKDDAAEVSNIQEKLKKNNATIYTIGFGKAQDGGTLKAIGGEENYIDTMKGSIDENVQKVFKTAFQK